MSQRQGLIAINYAARKFGIDRMATVTEAKKKCPNLIAQHVATWREGDTKWAYHEDAAANIATHKVSLDPYRLESRKILAVIKQSLPRDLQKVERSSIDEVFLDISAQVHATLLRRFPELAGPAPYDDPTERLPLPSVGVLDWRADALVDLDEETEMEGWVDWDDVVMLIGSEIVRDIRAEIRRELGYTCSAGVARNKMLSKLGSGHKKPNQQTVIRTRAVQHFLSDFKFTKIRNLGGKLGDHVVSIFNTNTVRDLLPQSIDQLKAKLGEDTGIWLYNTIRGIDVSEVNCHTQIKSMLSAKSFRPTVNTPDQAMKWLRIFVADIFSRLVEEGVLENKRRPKTISLHHRHGGQTRSRQSPIPQGKYMDETMIFELAKTLLTQIMAEGSVWPCANLSLSVGGFEDGVTGNMGIDAFLLKGEEAQGLKSSARDTGYAPEAPDKASKRRKFDDGGIQRFFTRKNSMDDDWVSEESATGNGGEIHGMTAKGTTSEKPESDSRTAPSRKSDGSMATATLRQKPITSYMCSRCDAGFESPGDLQSHEDWHMAKDLHDEERGRSAFVSHPPASRPLVPKSSGASSKRSGRAGGGKLEQGQRKLKFG
jgi:DNA polymerase eta